jgi:tripartite-type tricarboxylate transporter receptor subunit TctC
MKLTSRSLVAALAAAFALTIAQPAAAQSYPVKPVTLVVPFPPGGGGDFLARTLQERFSQALGQTVIIENKAGASGSIGSAHVAHAAPDGYTLVLGNIGTHAINAALFKKLTYDPVKDFVPISHAVNVRYAVIVGPRQKVANLGELVAVARQNPGKLNFASGGAGQGPHLGGEILKRVANIDIVHVPYKGGGPMMTALLAGEVDLMVTDLPSVIGQVKGGAVRALAVTAQQRSAVLPDTPTAAEAGFPDFEMYAWQALFAPAGTPAAIVDRINAAFVQALNAPDVAQRIVASGSEVVASSSAALAAFQEREVRKWTKVIADAGIKPE